MESRTTFSDSNDNSGSSSICFVSQTETLSPETCADVAALRRLSENLESIFSPGFDFCSDAKIVVDGDREVAVHRCILSARSPFFKNLFSTPGKEKKFQLKEFTEGFNVGFDALVAVLSYLYSGKVKPLPKDVYVCVDQDCSHIGCRPAIDIMVEVLYASFIFQISELVALYQRHLLDILDKVATDDLLVILSVANMCDKACGRLLNKCADIVVKSDIDITTLEKTLPYDIVKQIMDSREELGLHESESNKFPDKHVKRIHRALDSDDVELVRMLLKEGHTTLDGAYALHYAVAYCDAKTTTELLDLGLSDVNHLNPRGYTVLHVAAMRKEPKIIVSLLTKGARPSDLTPDGRKALQISQRLTKSVDYYRSTEEGKASPKDRLCIEILEQAERRDPLLGEASVSLAMAGDDLRMKLLYLENRVGLAKLLFPMEAKVAMDIAQVDGTLEFPLTIHSRNAPGGQRTVDLNEAPFKIEEEHLNRMRALSKTVELGKRFFPRCSDVLNKIMDADDLSELAYVGNDTPVERQLKKRRYMELQDILTKAFNEDKEEYDKSAAMSSSSSTTTIGVARSRDRFTLNKQNTNH
ncbi:BTB/POZ domain and ankyrin repeat-containing protein NPR1-like [Macadamia integrifolia]|uniref:BTB/POZ domain and ankyrin repeat-containing protein NPR1-like n=1 Tax=Macadamia integrifolia TaxID=60698 RepID=UPI001C4ED313|nr:BTB/POZ domain and ankyrin repeat-containing protein NPR1-like [Macadamia integrifolia]